MAFPTKCTPKIVAALCAALERGGPKGAPLSLAEACRVVGINRSIVVDWRKKARDGDAWSAEAMHRIELAREALKTHLLARVAVLAASGTKDDATKLRATQWMLEKLYRDEFDPPRQVELSGPEGNPIPTTARVVVLPELEPDGDGGPPPRAD